MEKNMSEHSGEIKVTGQPTEGEYNFANEHECPHSIVIGPCGRHNDDNSEWLGNSIFDRLIRYLRKHAE